MREILSQIQDYFEEFNIERYEVTVRRNLTQSITVAWEQDYISCTLVLFPTSKAIWSSMSDQFEMTKNLIRLKHGN